MQVALRRGGAARRDRCLAAACNVGLAPPEAFAMQDDFKTAGLRTMVGTSATRLPCSRCSLENARIACFSVKTGMVMSAIVCSAINGGVWWGFRCRMQRQAVRMPLQCGPMEPLPVDNER